MIGLESDPHVIHRDPPSNYASTKYAVGILSVAAILVATAASGLFNTRIAAAPDQAAAPQADGETPATADAAAKTAEAPAPDAAGPAGGCCPASRRDA